MRSSDPTLARCDTRTTEVSPSTTRVSGDGCVCVCVSTPVYPTHPTRPAAVGLGPALLNSLGPSPDSSESRSLWSFLPRRWHPRTRGRHQVGRVPRRDEPRRDPGPPVYRDSRTFAITQPAALLPTSTQRIPSPGCELCHPRQDPPWSLGPPSNAAEILGAYPRLGGRGRLMPVSHAVREEGSEATCSGPRPEAQ